MLLRIVLCWIVALAFGAEDPLHFRIVVKQRKEHGNALDYRGPELGLNAFPILGKPALYSIQLGQLLRVGTGGIESGTRLERDSVLPKEFAQLRCVLGDMAVFTRQVSKSESGEVAHTPSKGLSRDRHVVAAHDNLLGFLNSLFEERRRDRAFVYIEEGHIVVGHFVQQDDELDEIRVGLLPERFFPAAEKIV